MRNAWWKVALAPALASLAFWWLAHTPCWAGF